MTEGGYLGDLNTGPDSMITLKLILQDWGVDA